MNDYSTCPLGIENRKDIEASRELFTAMVDRLEEKMEDLHKDVNKGFEEVNGKIRTLDEKVDKFQKDLPDLVDKHIAMHDSKRAGAVVKWVAVTLLGSITISVITKLVLNAMNL